MSLVGDTLHIQGRFTKTCEREPARGRYPSDHVPPSIGRFRALGPVRSSIVSPGRRCRGHRRATLLSALGLLQLGKPLSLLRS